MSEVYNVVKLENFKEYLNQNGVSHKILYNPRIYEILDMILDDLSVINLDEESKNYIEKYLSIEKIDGGIIYKKDKLRLIIHNIDNGILLKIQQYIDSNSTIQMEKRFFDKNGIEYSYEIEKGFLDRQNFNKGINGIPTTRISYIRDMKNINLIIKSLKDKSVVLRKKYLIQETPYMLQNLRLTPKDLYSINPKGKSIDDLCEVLTVDEKIYEMMKEMFSEKDSEKYKKEIFKTYQNFNRMYQKTNRYEKAIATQLEIYGAR